MQNTQRAETYHLTPAGLERRLKRRLLKEKQRFFAITTPGFEKVLEGELRMLPACEVERVVSGGVEFAGPLALVYHANLKLRTANRVLMRVASFIARSYPELYNKAGRIRWELYSGFAREVALDASAQGSRLHHTDNIEKAVFDACAEHLQSLGVTVARRKEAAIRFLVRFAGQVCTVSVDTSGELLYKRGYRQETGHAPLRETVAAGLLHAARWDAFPVVADPLCGSGTFLVEAALMAAGRPAGGVRPFAFEHWPSFKPTFWERIKREAGPGKSGRRIRILGSDISASAIETAKRNAARAGVLDSIELSRRSCLEFNKDGSAGTTGLVIANLPYGKRAFAGNSDLATFYREWGAHLKTCCRGWSFSLISADRGFPAIAGLPVSHEMAFDNGGIPVTCFIGTVP